MIAIGAADLFCYKFVTQKWRMGKIGRLFCLAARMREGAKTPEQARIRRDLLLLLHTNSPGWLSHESGHYFSRPGPKDTSAIAKDGCGVRDVNLKDVLSVKGTKDGSEGSQININS
jgi:hypothetical protein